MTGLLPIPLVRQRRPLTDAERELVTRYVPLAAWLAKWWWERNRYRPLDDFTAVAFDGLLAGVCRHDPARGSVAKVVTVYINGHIRTWLKPPVAWKRQRSRQTVPVDPDQLDYLIDQRISRDALEDAETRAEVQAILDRLPTREAVVLSLRYGLEDGTPQTLQAIGASLGYTRERVRQIERDALRKIRSESL